MSCELCDRETPDLTTHHLVPREESVGGPTAVVCSSCHRQIHALFDNRTLARELSSIAALRAHPELSRFLQWVRRQPAGRRIRVRRARR